MNIGYLEQNGVTSTPDVPEELTASATLPRPASAGAAAASNRAHEDTILYDYPPAMGLKTPPGSARSSRHRGVNNLRKQHSVSCANHCCESKTKVWRPADTLKKFCEWILNRRTIITYYYYN